MKTWFHLKLEGFCRIMRKGERHWFLKDGAPKLVHVPEMAGAVTTKQAIYAAFQGDVPPGMELRAKCGTPLCVRPDHQELVQSRFKSRGLSLPNHLGALDKPKVFQPAEAPGVLPKGLTIRKIMVVKHMARTASLEEMRIATGLDSGTIMKIKGGVYDEAVRNATNSLLGKKFTKLAKAAKGPSDIPDLSPQPIPERVESEPTDIGDIAIEDEAEQAWLDMFKLNM